uniref:non-specific serine/threonine protein kinase n=1 Tax=Neospora caninum (strain Liverpool) TaxID=572307 RepID=A0A0F7UEP6_NEOCL|nr:TPA: FIK kinase (incomplete catalytic triad),putative [Neospora caninum Liverpool]
MPSTRPADWPRNSLDFSSAHSPPTACGYPTDLRRAKSCTCLPHVVQGPLTVDPDANEHRRPHPFSSVQCVNQTPPGLAVGASEAARRPQQPVSGVAVYTQSPVPSRASTGRIVEQKACALPQQMCSLPSTEPQWLASGTDSLRRPAEIGVCALQTGETPEGESAGDGPIVGSPEPVVSARRSPSFCAGCTSASRISMAEADWSANNAIPYTRASFKGVRSADPRLVSRLSCGSSDYSHGPIPPRALSHDLHPQHVLREAASPHSRALCTPSHPEMYDSIRSAEGIRRGSCPSTGTYNFVPGATQPWFPVPGSASFRSCSEPARSSGFVANSSQPSTLWRLRRDCGSIVDRCKLARGTPVAAACPETTCLSHPAASSEGLSHASSSFQLSQRTYSPEAVSRESQFCAASPRAQELLQSAVSASPHFAEDRAFPSSPDRRAELSPHCVPCAVEARLGGVVLPATKARTEEPPLNVSVDTNASNDVFGEGHVPGCSLPQSQRGSDGSKNSHGSGPQGTGTPMLSPLSEHSPEDTVPVCTGGHNGGVVPLSLTSFAEPGAAWVTAVRRQHAAASGAAAASGKSRNSKTQPGGGSVPSLYLEPPYSSSTPPPPIPNRTSRHIASFGTGYLSSSPTVERPSSPISFGVDRSPPCANMGNRTSSCSPYLRHPGEELSTDVTRSHTGNDFQALIAPGSRDAFSSQAAFTRFPDETARESLPGTLVSSNTAGTTQIISELHATSGHASPRTPALSKSGCSSSRTSPSRSSSVDPTRGSASFLTGEPSTSRGARMRPVSPHRPATSLRLPSPLFTCKGRSQSPRCLTQTPSGEHDKEDCTPQKSVDSLWESQDGTRRSATQIRSRALSPAYQLAASPLLGSTTPIPSGVTTDVAPAMLTERAPVQINANEQSGLLTTWEEAQGHPAPRLATPQSRHSETCDRHALPSPRGAQGRPASLHVSQTEGELGRATEAKNMTSYCSNSSAAQTLSAGSFASLAAAAAATSADAAVEWGGVSSAPQGSTCVLSSISSRDPGHAGDIDGRSHGLTSGGSSCGFISFDGLTVDLPTSRAPGSAPPDFPACEPDAGATPHATCEASETQGTAYQTCLSSCLDQGLPLGAATALSSRGSGRSALSHALSRRDGIGDSAFPPESDGLPSQAFSVCGASTLGSNGHRSPAVTSRGSVSPAKSVAGTGRAASTPRMSPRCRAPRCLSTPCSRSASRGTGRVRSPLSPRPEPIPDPSPSSHPALSDPGYSGQQETAQGVTSTRPSAAAHNAEGRSPTTFSPGGRSPMRRASVHTPAREQSLTPLEAPVELGHDLQTQSPKKVGASSPFVFRLDTPALSSVSSSATGRVSVASPARRLPRGGDRSSRNLGGASPSPLVTTGGSAGSSPRRPRASSPTFFSNRSGGSASPASSFAATARSAASGSPFARLGASRLGTPKMGTGYASLGASPAAPVGAWTPFRANLFSPGSAVQPTPVPYSPIDAISPFNGSCAAQLKSPRSANAVLGGRRSQSPSASAIGPSPSRPSPSKGDSVGFPMRTGAPGHLPLLAPLFGAHSPSPPSAGGAASRGSRDPGRHLGSSPQRPSSPFVQRGSPFFPSPSASPHNGDSPLIQRHGDMAPSCRTDRIGAEEANLSPSSGRDAKHPSRGNISPTTAAEAVAAAAAAAATLHSAEAVNAADEAHKTGDLAASSAALQVPGTASGVVGNQHNVFHDISAVPFRPHHASHTGKAFSPPSPSTPEKGAVDLRASTASVHTPLATSQSGEAPPPDVLPSLSPVAAAAASALPPETSALVLGHVFPNQITPNVRSDMALSRSSPFLTPRAAAAAARIRAEAAAAAAMAAAERAAAAARSSVSPRAVDASRRAADAAAHAVAAARRCASTSPRIAAASERAAAAIAAAAAASAAAAGSAKDLAEARRRAVPVAAAAAAVAAARQRAASTAAAAFPALNESVTRRESLSPAAGAKHIHMRAGAAATKAHEAVGRSGHALAASASAVGASAARAARGLPFISPGRRRPRPGENAEHVDPRTVPASAARADAVAAGSPDSRIAAVLRGLSPVSPAPAQAPQSRDASPRDDNARHRPTVAPFCSDSRGPGTIDNGPDPRGGSFRAGVGAARGDTGKELRERSSSAVDGLSKHHGGEERAPQQKNSRRSGTHGVKVSKAWRHGEAPETDGSATARSSVLVNSIGQEVSLQRSAQFPVWDLCRELVSRRTSSAKEFGLDGVPFDRWRLQVVPTMGASTTTTRCQRMWKGRLPSGRAVFIKKIPAAVWEQQWRLTQRYKGFFLTDGENFVGEAAFSAFLTDFGPPCAAPLLAVLHEDGNGLEGIHGSHGESEVPEPASSTSRVVLVNQGFGQGDLLDFFDNADPEVFTPASKRSLQYSVTQILVALHSAGIAHLDLTPENILVHAYTEALPSSITPQAGFGLSARGSCGSSTTPSAKLSGGSARRVQLKVCDLAKAAPLFNHSPFRLPPCILKAHFGDCGPENSVASSAAQPFLSCEPTVAKGPYMPPECWRIVYILRALGITAPFAQIGEPLLTTGRPPPPLYLKDPPQPGAPLLGPLREPIDLSVGVDAAELFFDVRKADIYMLGVLMFWIWAEGAIWTCSDPRQDTQYNDLLQCGLEFSIFTDCDGWPPELRHLLKGALDPDPTRRVTLAEILQHPWWTCSLSATGLESAPIS